jgi:hypothetical protein
VQRPEPVWADACVGFPEIIAGEVDVPPANWREVGKQPNRDCLAVSPPIGAPASTNEILLAQFTKFQYCPAATPIIAGQSRVAEKPKREGICLTT